MTCILAIFLSVLEICFLPVTYFCTFFIVFRYLISFVIRTFNVVREITVSNNWVEQSPWCTILDESQAVGAVQEFFTVSGMFGNTLEVFRALGLLTFLGD